MTGLTRPGNRAVAVAAERIRAVCAQHAVDAATLGLAIQAAPDHGLQRCVAFIFDDTKPAPSVQEMRRAVAAVERALDLPEPLEVNLAGPARRGVRSLRAGFAAVVLVLSGWLVIGGILTGQNEFARSTSPAAAVAVLIGALVLLAFLEAAHIGAVSLATADVSALAQSHPRVLRLHKHIATKSRLEEYLAARQVGVVLVVFFISEVTRTANMRTLPGTTVGISAAFDLLLQVGVPGALLVLVIGQVLPQILTARRPATMMNLAPMFAAFHLTRAIGSLGLARPASWLVQGLRKTERIPSAPRERYNTNRLDVDGYGLSAVHRLVRVDAAGTTATTTSTIQFTSDEFAEFPIDVATAVIAPRRVQVRAAIAVGDDRDLVVNELAESRLARSSMLRLSSSLTPRLGMFRAGDVVRVVSELDFGTRLADDVLAISAPTKLVTLRAQIDHAPVPFPFAVLTVSRDGEPSSIRRIPAQMNPDGTVELFTTVYYPSPGSLLHLGWGGSAMSSIDTTVNQQKKEILQ